MLIASYELNPIHSNQHSFYNKARVMVHEDNVKVLLSYGEAVAAIDHNNTPHILNLQTATTLKHIKEFLKQHGFKAVSKSQILKDYPKEGKCLK